MDRNEIENYIFNILKDLKMRAIEDEGYLSFAEGTDDEHVSMHIVITQPVQGERYYTSNTIANCNHNGFLPHYKLSEANMKKIVQYMQQDDKINLCDLCIPSFMKTSEL